MFFGNKSNLPETLPTRVEIAYQGETIPYQIERNNRLTRTKILFDREMGLRLILSKFADVQEGQRFLEQHLEWVYKQWKKYGKVVEQRVQRAKPLSEKDVLVYLGREYAVQFHEGYLQKAKVLPEDQLIHVYAETEGIGHQVLEKWYRQQAKAVITGALEYYRGLMKLEYSSLVIKDQKTRWGSCSSEGNLNFNYRLIMAPKWVMDYVVVHELAHLKEMNHSERFWKIVEDYFPRHKEAKKWLKEHGWGLVL